MDQINVQIPDDPELVTGCYVTLAIRVQRQSGETGIGLNATVAIEREGETCDHPWGLSDEKLTVLDEGGRISVANLSMVDDPADSDVAFASIVLANQFGVAAKSPTQSARKWFDLGAGPLDFCGGTTGIRLSGSGAPVDIPPLPPPSPDSPSVPADAGEIVELLGPGGRRAELSVFDDPIAFPFAYETAAPLGTDFLTAGEWRLRSAGGADIGAFDAAVRIPPAPEITAPPSITRGAAATFTWPTEGYAGDDRVTLFLYVASAHETVPNATLLDGVSCGAPATAGEFTFSSGLIDRIRSAPEGKVRLDVRVKADDALDSPAIDYGSSHYSTTVELEIPIN